MKQNPKFFKGYFFFLLAVFLFSIIILLPNLDKLTILEWAGLLIETSALLAFYSFAFKNSLFSSEKWGLILYANIGLVIFQFLGQLPTTCKLTSTLTSINSCPTGKVLFLDLVLGVVGFMLIKFPELYANYQLAFSKQSKSKRKKKR